MPSLLATMLTRREDIGTARKEQRPPNKRPNYPHTLRSSTPTTSTRCYFFILLQFSPVPLVLSLRALHNSYHIEPRVPLSSALSNSAE